MQYRVDSFLPKAFEAINNIKVDKKGFIKDDGKIAKEYKGYISSLGANMVQTGVIAALTFYEAEESGSKSDRRLINAAIRYIVTGGAKSDCKLTEEFKNLTGDGVQQKAMEIMDAATALKLAMRTFEMK